MISWLLSSFVFYVGGCGGGFAGRGSVDSGGDGLAAVVIAGGFAILI